MRRSLGKLSNSFEDLFGRQPTELEAQQVARIKDALQLKDNDAIWSVMLVMQYYLSLYEQFPQRIEATAEKTLNNLKATMDASAMASAAMARADLAAAVSKTAGQVAHDVAGKQRLRWLAIAIVSSCFAIGGFGLLCFAMARDAGYRYGYNAGYEAARDEKAAAVWANTPEGKAAYRLSKLDSIEKLVKCSEPGWSIEIKSKVPVCFVRPDKNGEIYGWQVPKK